MISILTINVALITVSFFGVPVFSFESGAKDRYKKLVDYLLQNPNDLVTLQEVSPYWSSRLIKDIKSAYPYSAKYSTPKIIPTEMLVLSKHPIKDCTFEKFKINTRLEMTFIQKGMLSCFLEVNDQELVVVTTHLVALGWFENSHESHVEDIRNSQINQIVKNVEYLIEEHPERLVVVTGDFNAGPESSAKNYELLLENFVDVFIWDEGNHGKNKIQYTWIPGYDDNFVAERVFKDSPPERIDMILIPKSQEHLLSKSDNSGIVQNDFSDHEGMESTINFE